MQNFKLLNLLVVAFMLVSVFTIYPGSLNAETPKKISVVTSFYPMYIMAINVCKDVPGVTVTNLTPPATGCLHDYSITTNDMKKLAGADVFIANGGGTESFLNKIIEQRPAVKIVILSDGIPLMKEEGKGSDNPHVWVSITGAMLEIKNLGDAMEAFDPANKGLYRKNTEAYINKLAALRSRMRSGLAPFKGKKIVTFHEAFSYFAQEFDLEIASVVEKEPGSEPNAKELAETINLVKKNGIKVIFAEPQYQATAANTITRETGLTVYELDPAVTGPDDPDAYINIMEKNLTVLKKALS